MDIDGKEWDWRSVNILRLYKNRYEPVRFSSPHPWIAVAMLAVSMLLAAILVTKIVKWLLV